MSEENTPEYQNYLKLMASDGQDEIIRRMIRLERELAAMKQEKHLSEQSASYNIDWFDCLVSDLAKILGCESKASAVIEAARVAAQRKG